MHGAGTKAGITSADTPPVCLDLTRLISRAGRHLTGVDRVELAYLDHFLNAGGSVFALIRTSLGYLLLDREGALALREAFASQDWSRRSVLSRFTNRGDPMRQAAESLARRLSISRCRPAGLARIIARHVPLQTRYVNVGHSNLSARVLKAFVHHRIVVMIHDTIPIDHPAFQADGVPERFSAMLRRVGAQADLVIYNSAQSRADAERWFTKWGQSPKGCVALLGIIEPVFEPTPIETLVNPERLFFVCVGTIEPRKNHALLLDIWEDFRREYPEAERPQLVIAGARGWKNEQTFARLDRLLSSADVIEANDLTDDQVFSLLQASNGLLFPSLAEGFGLPPAEAIQLGVPALVSDLGVYREFLGDRPVYLGLNDQYCWKKAIVAHMKTVENAPPLGADPLPTWDEHFNTVLKLL